MCNYSKEHLFLGKVLVKMIPSLMVLTSLAFTPPTSVEILTFYPERGSILRLPVDCALSVEVFIKTKHVL